MSQSPRRKADFHFTSKLRSWRQREADLLAGAVIPTMLDRYAGHSPFRGSALLDLQQMVDIELERDQLPTELAVALQKCRLVSSSANCHAACQLADAAQETELAAVLLWHAALRGHDASIDEIREDTLYDRRPHDRVAWACMCALVTGLSLTAIWLDVDEEGRPAVAAVDVAETRDLGFQRLRLFGDLAADHEASLDVLENATEETAATGMPGALAAMKAAKVNDLNSVEDMLADGIEEPSEAERSPTLLAVPGDPARKPTGARADAYKGMKGVVGKDLPLVDTSRLASARTTLHARYPHMHAEIDAILATQAALPAARLSVLLVSDPGLGKTTVARDIGEALGLPQITYNCAGVTDSSFGGTSAQWTNVRCSVPLQIIGRSKVANPLVVLDEIDKIGTGKHNGSLADVLLGFLEKSSARAYHDIALEQDVDLSAVSYIATANNLHDVPAPLRDRLKIVRIPAPGWQHIGVLSERIIDDLAKDRNLDRRWFDPLAEDEVEIVRKAWPGGSIRRLQWIVTRLVDGREQLMGRA
tara:strand:+ start:12708 stop:14303 length:1596 start_codon:yes stop_codon:yes gene_type:complete